MKIIVNSVLMNGHLEGLLHYLTSKRKSILVKLLQTDLSTCTIIIGLCVFFIVEVVVDDVRESCQ